MSGRLKAIRCAISRGGFSDERVFRFDLEGEKYEGVGSRRHMWKEDGSPIQNGEPPEGEELQGLVATRILAICEGETHAQVSIPDGGVIEIPIAQLEDRPSKVGQNVPV